MEKDLGNKYDSDEEEVYLEIDSDEEKLNKRKGAPQKKSRKDGKDVSHLKNSYPNNKHSELAKDRQSYMNDFDEKQEESEEEAIIEFNKENNFHLSNIYNLKRTVMNHSDQELKSIFEKAQHGYDYDQVNSSI